MSDLFMRIGYARVSTDDQNLDSQRHELLAAGCDKIFHDTSSGAVADRPGLTFALSYLRPGDTLVVWKLDRLGRSTKALIGLVDELQARDINLHCITQGFDTGTPAGRMFFTVMAAIAELEREMIRERTQAGLAAARARGRNGGRRPKLTKKQIEHARTLLPSSSVFEIAASLKVDRSTLYRALNRKADKTADPAYTPDATPDHKALREPS